MALKDLVKSLYAKWKPSVVLIEERASGYQLIQELDSIIPILPFNPSGSKLARLMKCVPIIQAGYVFFPEYAVWLQDFECEICSFPYSAHDDQVDSMTQAILWVQESFVAGFGLREL
ncbi:phage terminase large subunit [Anaplasma platys]|uniref:Phage terminase large subunit n=1 Tax=Anaplasma platys TaxID=949 RepID=A0A858PY83_9RICK|nr:phage terminase large subunit [Anaplasma platys]